MGLLRRCDHQQRVLGQLYPRFRVRAVDREDAGVDLPSHAAGIATAAVVGRQVLDHEAIADHPHPRIAQVRTVDHQRCHGDLDLWPHAQFGRDEPVDDVHLESIRHERRQAVEVAVWQYGRRCACARLGDGGEILIAIITSTVFAIAVVVVVVAGGLIVGAVGSDWARDDQINAIATYRTLTELCVR